MKPRFWVILLATSVLTILGSYFVAQHLRVRDAGFQAASLSPVWRGEGYNTVAPDRNLSRMVTRAKLDHFIAPIEGLRGRIIFEEARSKGDEVYLFFRPSNVSDTVILYCGNRHNRKLLWKMELVFDA